ncbi:hypothetical protein LCGC14_1380560 [marine sediment metagenome]|uniref:Uncharacterized protein n=1 Tax=marine sediment metagenome TaxID=412755 RepID=A0A0F9MI82_9ZZZZ
MRALFNILERRFKGDNQLVKVGRKLYEGFAGEREKSVLPYIEVTFGNTEVLDTFATDFEDVETDFTINTKDVRTSSVDAIMRAVRRVYKDAIDESDELSLVVLRYNGSDGPTVEDGVYRATMSFIASVQRKVLLPAVRGA